MPRGEKLLQRMRASPNDWRIQDVRSLCSAYDIDFDRPFGSSHYGVSQQSQPHHLTVPFARPIKPV